MTASPRLGFTELTAGQAVPETTVNEMLRYVEQGAGLFQFKDRDLSTPPGSPADGDCYLVKATGTGAWAGKDGKIAFYENTAWVFITVKEGFSAYVNDEDVLVSYNGATWTTMSSGSGSYQPLDADLTALAGLTSAADKIPYFTGSAMAALLTRDTDGTLAANSDTSIATQKAVKTYVDAAVTGLLDLKGSTDCSANPNYPAASKGDYYVVSVAGKIGGASGTTVAIGDIYFAIADNAGGTQASVGSSWDTLVHASVAAGGGLLAANNLSDVVSATTSRTNIGVGTGDSPQFAGVNIGNASDTTVTRTGAGDIAVEGNALYRAGGTDVPVTDGGTGSSTAGGARANLGATTAGGNIFTIANPSAITFLRVNADNSVDTLSAAAFRTAIGAGTGSGSGDLLSTNNLSDLTNAATARTNLGITSANVKLTESIIIAASDESTAITTGTSKVTFRMPYAFTVSDVRASVNTAPTGSTILIDINESGTTILSTKLMIDATEKTSTTAATPAVISDSSLADDAEITIDFDQVGSTISGKGVKVVLIGTRT